MAFFDHFKIVRVFVHFLHNLPAVIQLKLKNLYYALHFVGQNILANIKPMSTRYIYTYKM